MRNVRLLVDPPASGPWNMAVDEVLLETAAKQQLATLRFYQWEKPTLSLGYFQKVADRESHTSSLSCELVRRASGGGAILHDQELTYSFAFPVRDPRDAEVTDYFDQFHQALIRLLDHAGILAQTHESSINQKNTNITIMQEKPFLCFQRRSPVDVVLEGHKVCGSAQRRGKGAVLQHGSLLVQQSEFAPELPGLTDLGSLNCSYQQLIEAWISELNHVLEIGYEKIILEKYEHNAAVNLVSTKYGQNSWTSKK